MTTPAEAIREAAGTIAAYTPSEGKELDDYMNDLPDAIEEFVQAFRTQADAMADQHPLQPAFTDKLREYGSGNLTAEGAREVAQVHDQEHQFWTQSYR
jgi:hypothetical protein